MISALRVGLTQAHGMAHETSMAPPDAVRYEFLKPKTKHHGLIRSPLKGYMRRYEDDHVDLVEAVLSPAITDRPWICSLDCFQAAIAFSILGCPLPKLVRRRYIERLFLRDNFKRMIFWSKAAARTLCEYGGVINETVIQKSSVVYPAIRQVPRAERADTDDRDELRLLFGGDFFRKGGAHVVDAFTALRKEFPRASLRLCCDADMDFNTPDRRLKEEYLGKIAQNPGITFGRVSRESMLKEVLPQTDIFLLPTYAEAFGFAILEAMAHGIPVVATNTFAIPEIIEHNKTGLLIDTADFDLEAMFRGYVVRKINPEFKTHMTDSLYAAIKKLANSPQLRRDLGDAARRDVAERFSFERRNQEMLAIYHSAMS